MYNQKEIKVESSAKKQSKNAAWNKDVILDPRGQWAHPGQVTKIPSGNIIGIVGLKDTFAGETISSEPMEPFEAIKHVFEPVITKSIEAKKASDLAKLIEVLKIFKSQNT